MKISHRNVAYSEIPRLVQEGVIKVGTRVKACEDQNRYLNVLDNTLRIGDIGTITAISDESFNVFSGDRRRGGNALYTERGFLDILSDEQEEGVLTHSEIGKGVKSKPLPKKYP